MIKLAVSIGFIQSSMIILVNAVLRIKGRFLNVLEGYIDLRRILSGI